MTAHTSPIQLLCRAKNELTDIDILKNFGAKTLELNALRRNNVFQLHELEPILAYMAEQLQEGIDLHEWNTRREELCPFKLEYVGVVGLQRLNAAYRSWAQHDQLAAVEVLAAARGREPFTASTREMIIDRVERRMTMEQIGAKFGITPQAVSHRLTKIGISGTLNALPLVDARTE